MKIVHAICKVLLSPVTCVALMIGCVDVEAAKAPMSQERLEKESQLIVTGNVISLTSKVQQSKHERAFGIHRDRVYTIKLKVTLVSKGTGVKKGEEIVVEAWRPTTRIPPLPGLQGHVPLSSKGDTVKMYLLKNKQTKRYEPLLPNGIEIQEESRTTR
ncbi:MAG: hypothetical protein VB877_00525 [Pirellulaceae bacterium]